MKYAEAATDMAMIPSRSAARAGGEPSRSRVSGLGGPGMRTRWLPVVRGPVDPEDPPQKAGDHHEDQQGDDGGEDHDGLGSL